MEDRPKASDQARWRYAALPVIFRFTLQYCAAMASVAPVDITMNSMYFMLSGQLTQMYIVVPESLVILDIVNGLVAIRIFSPIERYIKTGKQPDLAWRVLARLSFRSAVWVACLKILYCLFLFIIRGVHTSLFHAGVRSQGKFVFALAWFSLKYAAY